MDQEQQSRVSQPQSTDHASPVILTETPIAEDAKQDRRLSDEWGSYNLTYTHWTMNNPSPYIAVA
jgi:hypothetical protein